MPDFVIFPCKIEAFLKVSPPGERPAAERAAARLPERVCERHRPPTPSLEAPSRGRPARQSPPRRTAARARTDVRPWGAGWLSYPV